LAGLAGLAGHWGLGKATTSACQQWAIFSLASLLSLASVLLLALVALAVLESLLPGAVAS
jgi:hypothetical protein